VICIVHIANISCNNLAMLLRFVEILAFQNMFLLCVEVYAIIPNVRGYRDTRSKYYSFVVLSTNEMQEVDGGCNSSACKVLTLL